MEPALYGVGSIWIIAMKTKKPTLILSFTLLVVMIGYGMVLPVMPFYIERLGAGGRELGWLMSAYSLMQLI